MEHIRTEDLAEAVGVHVQRIYQWAREGLDDAAKIKRGVWHKQKAIDWIAARRAVNVRDPNNLPDTPANAADLITARRDYILTQDKLAQERLALLRAQVVTRATVDALLVELGTRILEPLDQWVRAGGNARVIAERKEAADDIRTAWERSVEDLARTLDAGEDLSPSRTRLSRRMGG